MNPITLLSAALVISALAGSVAARLTVPAPSRPANGCVSEDLERVEAALASVESRQSSLATELEVLRAQLAARELGLSRSAAEVPLAEIENAVARVLEARVGDAIGAADRGDKSRAGDAADARRAYEELLALHLSGDLAETKWKEIGDAGLLDEVVALFEQRAREHPDDPEAQSDLGLACMKQSVRLIGTQDGYAWVVKGDKCFDAALAIDERNWRARFMKATGLSFWPPVLGKQAEAIRHFEILVAQQDSSPVQPGFAKAYLFLGNLYLQSGDAAKALATWKQGRALFPHDAELQSQIESAEQR